MCLIDRTITTLLPLLATYILISGLDDVFLDLVWAFDWIRRRARRKPDPVQEALESTSEPERRIAIFVPLWHEHSVIGRMLEHNLGAIRYRNFTIFAGAYPNDELTIAALREAEQRYPSVRLALCPHDGPTSKADCLNWVYQRMLAYEEEHGLRFDIVVVHDAEDLVHPDELCIINHHSARYGMVQVPVLPLATPAGRLTHGVYCEDFAEFQTKDLAVRTLLGGFLPSCGVGTGFTREALEALAQAHRNCIFDPVSLTEDYENGLRLARLGCPQLYVPVRFRAGRPVATREFFPQTFRTALKQRTRWVMGTALQSWERHGWRGSFRDRYWFWRDRKGIAGNFVSAFANLAFLYGVATWGYCRVSGAEWGLGTLANEPWSMPLFWATSMLQLQRTVIRIVCTGRIYGWGFAMLAPVRMIWANWINVCSTVEAGRRYAAARLQHQPLVWLKTEHAYPSHSMLRTHKPLLGEILVRGGLLPEARLQEALGAKPAGMHLGAYLVQIGAVRQADVYRALGEQQNVRFGRMEPSEVPLWIARALPGAVSRKWNVLPFRVAEGRMYVAGPDLPTEEMQRELRGFTRLELRFHLITPENYQELAAALLGKPPAMSNA